jgi:hypothetical protein
MPFDMQQFMTRVKTGNRLFTLAKSSLQPLINLLGIKQVFTPTEKASIQRAVAYLPFAKRQRYAQALQYLGQAINISVSAIPCNPRMAFHEYAIHTGAYGGVNSRGEKKLVWLDPRSAQPGAINGLGPFRYLHTHRLSWSSSDGNAASIANVLTWEHVRFLTDPQAPPFNKFADPDRDYYMPEGGASGATYNDDDHMLRCPAVTCSNPRVAGSLVGEQVYQYSTDHGATWQPIEGAAYLLEKRVYKDGNYWVMVFKKTNWAAHNTVPFHFEVEYTVGDPPDYLPTSHQGFQRTVKVLANIQDYARRVISTG